MIDEIKILLGDAATNYTDAHISLAFKIAKAEVEEYCARELDTTLELIAEQIAVIKLLRSGTEGLTAQSLSGISETYVNGYPADIQAVLNRKRKIRTVG